MEKIINLSGRIDSNNISEIENKILDSIKDYNGEIVFDAKDLEYISSAGLRMILKVKKINDKTKVINCSSSVYEIFEMTGFSEMMDISKGFRTISVDNCEVIGDGFYGTVYRVDPETIVKVYKKPDCLDMVKREKELSRKAFVKGIPTAIPYDIVKVGDSYGSIFELLDCKSLDTLIKEGESIEKFYLIMMGSGCCAFCKVSTLSESPMATDLLSVVGCSMTAMSETSLAGASKAR